jgi:hypothetical protein
MPYVWGAKGPGSFDCSGLTSWAWGQAGYQIGLSTYDQASAGVSIPCVLADLAGSATTCWAAGDLIFLRYSGGQHVSMYIGDGLFADAYNPATGVIIHDISGDSFYAAHFWQARRIVQCNGASVHPGSPDSAPGSAPGLEEIPNLIAFVSLSVPQCNSCSPGGTILPATSWGEAWPAGWELLDPTVVFRKSISWLAWQIGEIVRQALCWVLAFLQFLANILSTAFNFVIAGINGIWKLGVFSWLTARAWFYGFWDLFESIRGILLSLDLSALAGLLAWLSMLRDLALAALALAGQILLLVAQVCIAALGLIGWIGGLALGMFRSIIVALGANSIPTQLSGTHISYQMMRGALEAIIDSPVGWMVILLWGMCYVGFVFWMSRFLSVGKDV